MPYCLITANVVVVGDVVASVVLRSVKGLVLIVIKPGNRIVRFDTTRIRTHNTYKIGLIASSSTDCVAITTVIIVNKNYVLNLFNAVYNECYQLTKLIRSI